MPDYDFWNERWLNNQIGFHQKKPHPSLVKFNSAFSGHKKILVPLCGKSLDMIYLRDQGFEVIGVEFSELAILDFMKENNLTFSKSKVEAFQVFKTNGITIYQGNFFQLTKNDLKGVTACYDRASMVAFDPEERVRYAQKLKSIGDDLKTALVIVFNYGAISGGPPYSVINEEIQSLYTDFFKLKILSEEEFPLRDALKERGAVFEKETTWQFSKEAE